MKRLKTLALFASFFAILVASCGKSDTTSKTIIKCVTCANGGLCVHDTCQCPAGYEGITCETLAYQKFTGNWNVTEKGSISPTTQFYNIEISSPGTSSSSLVLFNLDNNALQLACTISGDSIYIPQQTTINNKSYVGVGYIYTDATHGPNGAITMRYKVTDETNNTTNDFGYISAADNPSQWTK